MILVLHQGAIGDFLLTLPVIEAVKAATRASRVEVIASATSARVAAGRSVVDSCTSPELVGMHTLFSEESNLNERLAQRLRSASLVLSFLGGPAEALHRRLRVATTARVVSVDPRPTPETLEAGRHITEQWATTIREQGLAIGDLYAAHIRVEKTHGEPPQTGMTATRRVLIHPGSGGRSKCWPIERFMAMADEMNDVSIAWMLGPAECEPGDDRFTKLRERIRQRGEELIVEQDLLAAVRRIAQADLFIGNDSGVTHLAAAVGVRTIAVFTTTDPRVWRPLGDHVAVMTGLTKETG